MLKKFSIGLAFVGALMFAGSNVFVSSVRAEVTKEEAKKKVEENKDEVKTKVEENKDAAKKKIEEKTK